MPTPLLAFAHVTVRHLDRVLFPDLSLRIEPGRHLALVGPSGAGKSALLAALAGQLLLTGGRAAYPGLEAAARQRRPTDPLAAWRQVESLVGARAPFRARAAASCIISSATRPRRPRKYPPCASTCWLAPCPRRGRPGPTPA